MKITNKKLKPITEAAENLGSANAGDIEKELVQSANQAGVEVNTEAAAEEAEKVKEISKLIVNPYGEARPNKIERTLQRSLVAALDQRDSNLKEDYPNVVIYGLAGFGKTAIVKKFCADHNINCFECDAKSLDIATVGGIPYPKVNPKTGETTQAPIASQYWKGLEEPNTVLFLDEINRATGKIRGTLLSLINNHVLPAHIEDPKTGKTASTKFYPNLLFSVIAINPADDVFEDAEPLDPAMVSRNGAVISQDPDTADFLKHLNEIYDAIGKNPYLAPRIKNKYAGQQNLANAILKDPNFAFDDADDVRNIYFAQGKTFGNYLNYRSFLLTLLRSNGTKEDYLEVIEDESGFQQTRKDMLKNILADYVDKASENNTNVFGAGTGTNIDPTRQQKAANDIENILGDWTKSLGGI